MDKLYERVKTCCLSWIITDVPGLLKTLQGQDVIFDLSVFWGESHLLLFICVFVVLGIYRTFNFILKFFNEQKQLEVFSLVILH